MTMTSSGQQDPREKTTSRTPHEPHPCTTCGGSGLVNHPIYDAYGNIAHSIDDPCPRCGGSGKEEPGGPG